MENSGFVDFNPQQSGVGGPASIVKLRVKRAKVKQ